MGYVFSRRDWSAEDFSGHKRRVERWLIGQPEMKHRLTTTSLSVTRWAYNIDFVLAQSTGQALAELKKQQFDAIISDMGRPPDSRAGYTLLEAVRGSGDQTPYFIYAGSKGPHACARSAQGQGTTNMGDELLQMLLQALNV